MYEQKSAIKTCIANSNLIVGRTYMFDGRVPTIVHNCTIRARFFSNGYAPDMFDR